ncbi:TMV resistance protein N-like [Prunus avium]|uniref:ADP-ribosyl cyclase/cyclic ADP-ribose hydrolase n=1 Tax=Prunus avium TaxID=42229 RepID=A0A6P5TES7_PRUAV|nr:TMV resistance protein N-like [Prunus avium]
MFIILLLLILCILLHLVNFLLGRASTPELEHEEAPQVVHSSSSSSTLETLDFDVFLSFRGEDTRNSFTDHLYYGLKLKGIDTFRDEEKLERGKPIAPKLLKAIEHSKFAVIVLSEDYASSTWCLDELAHIVQCMEEGRLDVFPIFYHIEASEVRKQTGNFGKAFAKHEENFKKEKGKVKKWRRALRKVANVAGWDLKNRKESEVIQKIANKISNVLNDKLSSPNNDLVGMDSRITKMEEYLTLRRLDDVRTIGIWGFGGIGKTTLATEVFKKIRNQFGASRFVSSVREESAKVNGLVGLQKSLSATLLYCDEDIQNDDLGIQLLRTRLRNKKVLIVLDDVDKLDQIKALADESWLGPGSRVIITTREKHGLDTCGLLADNIYEVDKLKVGEDFQLFCRKAFKENDAPHDYKELSKKFVEYAGGIPLALVVLGSYLRGKNVIEWSEAFDRLDEDPEKDIMNVLKVSFDALKDTVKQIFLDIACFFNGEDQVRVKRILASCWFYPESGIRDLLDKALIKINERNELLMHDLLQKMGQDIVHRKFPNEPGKRSRLWINENAYKRSRSWHDKVLAENTEEIQLDADPLAKMCVNFSRITEYFSKDLRLLEWDDYPLGSLPSSFKPCELVELKMPNSRITQLWHESCTMMENLVQMDLSNCKFLIKTPDFRKVPNLERLILEGSEKLSEVHPTIGDLQRLVVLNMEGCGSLESLPHSISLESLKTFNLSGCSKLKEFPEIVGNMEALSELYLDETAIRKLPASIQQLRGLILLNLNGCKNLTGFPMAICSLTSLRYIYMSGCSRIDILPENLGSLEQLQVLDACKTAITKMPGSILLLPKLKRLCFRGNKDVAVESSVFDEHKDELAESSVSTEHRDVQMESSVLFNEGTTAVKDILLSLLGKEEIQLDADPLAKMCVNFSRITEYFSKDLRLLEWDDYPLGSLPSSFKPCELVELKMPNSRFTHLWHESCTMMENLVQMDLSNCKFLIKTPDFRKVPNLERLILEGCESLESLPYSISLKSLKTFDLSGCSKLKEFPETGGNMEALSELYLDGTAIRKLLASIRKLRGFILLNLRGCKNLTSFLMAICSLTSSELLQELDACKPAITKVPVSVLSLPKLKRLFFRGKMSLRNPLFPKVPVSAEHKDELAESSVSKSACIR